MLPSHLQPWSYMTYTDGDQIRGEVCDYNHRIGFPVLYSKWIYEGTTETDALAKLERNILNRLLWGCAAF